ncbi:hypothetical protein [Streptomyces sp. NPDC059009]|uniref:hypothetical protein n=1 Tax=Streptomyces sp. NPDC059009 TaxID=3346694 RepID=UPI00367D2B31
MEIGRDGGRDDPALPNDNAPHATLPARVTDHAVRAGCRALAALWSALGLRAAAATLRHYLDGTGTPYELDADRLLAVPAVRAAVTAQSRRWRTEAPETPGTYPADSGWRGVLVARRDSLDWWLALRGIQYRVRGTVTVAPDGTRTSAIHSVAFHKSWNFDRGESEYGVPFAPFARLHETGLAREFEAVGETVSGTMAAGRSPGPS